MVSQKVLFTSVACATLVAGVLGMSAFVRIAIRLLVLATSLLIKQFTRHVAGLLLGHFVVTPDKKGGRHALARTMPRLSEAQVREAMFDLIDAKEIERFLRYVRYLITFSQCS
jgi:hypothetical protein